MLDIRVDVDADPADALDIVSLAEMKRHLRITHTKMDDVITDAIKEAVDFFDFRDGVLNRTVLPRTLTRFLRNYPSGSDASCRVIRLPYPPIIDVIAITTITGSITLDPSTYTVTNTLVPEIFPDDVWPDIDTAAQAVAIQYTAGYETAPPRLKRMVKIMAAHFIENPEATINEPRQMMINRKVDFGIDHDLAKMRIPNGYDDWDE